MAKVWLYKTAVRFVTWTDGPPCDDCVGPIDIPDGVLWQHDDAVLELDDCPDLDAYWEKHTGTGPFPDGRNLTFTESPPAEPTLMKEYRKRKKEKI